MNTGHSGVVANMSTGQSFVSNLTQQLNIVLWNNGVRLQTGITLHRMTGGQVENACMNGFEIVMCTVGNESTL